MATSTPAKKATTKAPAKKADVTVTVRSAYRVEFAAQVAALRVVGAFGRLSGNAEVLEAYRALIKQTYRPAGSVVRWAKPEHRTMHGKSIPANGSTMIDFVEYVTGLMGAAPDKGQPGHEEHAASLAALAAFGKVAK